jgi:hypothetical protein
MAKLFDAGLEIYRAMQQVQCGVHPAVAAAGLARRAPSTISMTTATKKLKAMEMWALGGRTVAQIAEETGLHKSTVYDLTKKMRLK